MNSSILTRKSPILPVTPKTPPPRVLKPPNNGVIVLNNAENACLPMSKTANIPLNVLFKFADAVSLSFR